MTPPRRTKIRWGRWLLALAALAWLALTIDDPARDFVGYEAKIEADAAPELRPYETGRSLESTADAVRAAASRIRNWEYIGESGDETRRILVFVRTARLTRIRDDLLIEIEDRGDRRVVTGESRSRLHLGDLGRNPRNLERLLQELRLVLRGAAPEAT